MENQSDWSQRMRTASDENVLRNIVDWEQSPITPKCSLFVYTDCLDRTTAGATLTKLLQENSTGKELVLHHKQPVGQIVTQYGELRKDFLSLIQTNTSLKSLCLHAVDIRGDRASCDALVNMIKQNNTIETLVLGHWMFGDDEFTRFCSAINYATCSLKKLVLFESLGKDNEYLRQFCLALKGNSSLVSVEILNLESRGFRLEDARMIKDILKHNRRIKELEFTLPFQINGTEEFRHVHNIRSKINQRVKSCVIC